MSGSSPGPRFEKQSKTSQKKQARELKELGMRLVAVHPKKLAGLGLPADLLQALLDAGKISSHEGRRRQMQYIGKLMRQVDAEPIRERLEGIDTQQQAADRDFKTVEAWRDALLLDDDPGLPERIEERLPEADAGHIRSLTERALRERENNLPPHASRALFRYLRALLESPHQEIRPEEIDPPG